MKTHAFDLVVFDLDGTLIETAPEICDAVNDTLLHFKLTPASQAQVALWIGHGTRELLIQAVANSSGQAESAVRGTDYFEQIAAVFTTYYNQRCGTRSIAYAGAVEALEKLSAAGVHLAIVTNKEAAYTRRVLDAHGLTSRFKAIVSGDTLPTKKPSPEGVAFLPCGLCCSRQQSAVRRRLVHRRGNCSQRRAGGVGVFTRLQHGPADFSQPAGPCAERV